VTGILIVLVSAGAALIGARVPGGGIASGSLTLRNDSLGAAWVRRAVALDRSPPLALLVRSVRRDPAEERVARVPGALAAASLVGRATQGPAPIVPPVMTAAPGSAAVEQTRPGAKPPAGLVASFDGLGAGFTGPQGSAALRSPSDNTLAVGPDHIVQIVNARMAIFTKQGRRFDTTGKVLYGAVPTNTVFRGFGGPCELRNNGDAVVRYDQLADRWLLVMPIFRRGPPRPNEPEPARSGEPARRSEPGQPGQPGPAARLYQPPPAPPPDSAATPPAAPPAPGAPTPPAAPPPAPQGSYAMCYAVSTGPDPFGPWYRYEFVRPLFPDYPRPAVWPDGYYVPTSTGDDVIQKHACVVDRRRMLRGESATEQCVVIDSVNFLNNADLDGKALPPAGAPNIILSTGGVQLRKLLEDDGLYAWSFHVDWDDPSKTRVTGPQRIAVAPYHYLC